MTALQLAIGSLNDTVDAPSDAGRKPGKPIPAGLVGPAAARGLMTLEASSGLLLSAASGPALAALGVLVLLVGFGYDLWLKGTAWSWLPFAVGIPLLPVYAWIGARGSLAPVVGALALLAVMAGAGLALANSLVDLERDIDAGLGSPVAALGRERAWRVSAFLLIGVFVIGIVSLVVQRGLQWQAAAAIGLGLAAVAAGLALGRAGDPANRERGWELETIGVGIAGLAWLAAILGTGRV